VGYLAAYRAIGYAQPIFDLVLQDSALQIMGDACVQNCIGIVSHDIEAVLFFGHSSLYFMANLGGFVPE
jgi:hypothetical protein